MDSFMKQFQHLKINLEEIASATNNFDDNNSIGSGGFGKVYKGELHQFKERGAVAFKRLDRIHGQGDAEFLKEITFLSRYRHENLISLLGYCIQDKEMILAFEHASRGSLDRHLGSTDLTWKQRLKICLSAAKGLNYLHDPRETSQRLIHCDIKSANILLDDQWNAKVADFGLSKIAPANKQNSVVVTNALGTPGYCDPVFMRTYSLTKESDVYSFGVVLLEVLCGKQCFEIINGTIKVLVPMWKKSYEENNLDEIIFPDLRQNMEPTSLKTFLEIAFQCLKRCRMERPKMSLVVEKLETAIKCHQLKPPKEYEEIVTAAVPLLMYESIEELKVLLSKGFLVNDGKAWFSLNDNREHCEFISIKECLVQSGRENHSDRYSTEYNSRFLVGSYETLTCNFKIRVRAKFLSPVITYTVNLVFKLYDEKDLTKQPDIELKFKLVGETKTSIAYLADKRDDDWWMLELCHFTSQGTTVDLEIIFEDNHPHLVVQGIELLPAEMEKEEHQVLEDVDVDDTQTLSSDTDSDTYWEQKLPIDYQDIIKLSKDSVQWTTKKELYLILYNGFLLDNGQEWLSIDKNGKRCLMLSPRETCVLDTWKLNWRSLPESRFREAMELEFSYFRIVTEINSQLLSSQTTYATYLVYKSSKDQSSNEVPLQVKDGTSLVFDDGKEADFWYVFLVGRPTTPVIVRGKVDENTVNPLSRPKIKGLPHKRSDGWTEVQVWEFQTPTTNKMIPMHLKLTMPNYNTFDGFIIQGIEFRPI